MIKTTAKIASYVIMGLIALILTLCIVIRNPWVQTTGVRLAADYLSGKLHTEFRIGGFHLSWKNGLVIDDILVKDQNQAVLLSAKKIGVIPGFVNLKQNRITISRVFIETCEFQLLTHKGDSSLNLQFLIDFFSSTDTTKKQDTTPGNPIHLEVSEIDLNNIRFHFQDENKPLAEDGMDYSNIDVNDIYLNIKDFQIVADTFYATISQLAAVERSGFQLHHLEGEFSVSPAFLKANNLKIRTEQSDLRLDFAFLYKQWSAYTDFLHDITIQANLLPSGFNLSDIGYFAPVMKTMKDMVYVSGSVKGPVSKLSAKDFTVKFGDYTNFSGNIYAMGLPDIYSTFVDLQIHELTTHASDLTMFKLPGNAVIELPELFQQLGLVSVKGVFTGFYNDFSSISGIQTDIGTVKTNLLLQQKGESEPLSYKGDFQIVRFDVGKITGNTKGLGLTSLRATVEGKGISFEAADLSMRVHIDSAMMNHYTYKNFDLNGTLIRKRFFGDLEVNDPNLQLVFHGTANFYDSLPKFNFTAKIDHAQLFALHLLERDSVEKISGLLRVDFTGNNLDNLDGMIRMKEIVYEEANLQADMDELYLHTENSPDGTKSYFLNCDYADAEFSGTFEFSKLIPSMSNFIHNYLANFNMQKERLVDHQSMHQLVNYSIDLHQTDELTAIFLPFLNISQATTITGQYHEDDQLFTMEGNSPLIKVNHMEIVNWTLKAKTKPDDLWMNTGCQTFVLSRSKQQDSLNITLDTLSLIANIRNDSILYNIGSDGEKQDNLLAGFITFRNDSSVLIKMTEMDLNIANRNWRISEENFVILDTAFILFHDVEFTSGKQQLGVNGKISGDLADTLKIDFNELDLSEVDYFSGSDDLDVDGVLSGTLKLMDVFGELSVYSDLMLERFVFNKVLLGDASFKVDYNRQKDRFEVVSEIIYTGNIGKSIPFSLTGNYFLAEPDPYFDFKLKLKNLDLRMIRPFVSSFMSKLTGLVSGEVSLTGDFKKPLLLGEIDLQRTEFNISYINVPYSLSDVVKIDSNSFDFNQIILYDSVGAQAMLNGQIRHHYFQELFLDLTISLNDFAAFNNTYAQNQTFFGTANASGTVKVSGGIDDISVAVNASTGKNTAVTIPINLTQGVDAVDYILFVDPKADTVQDSVTVKSTEPVKGLTLDMNLLVKPDAKVEVFLPDQLGNIKAAGTGNLSMGMTPATPFDLRGSYVIDKGSFLFQMKNLLRLSFTISPGGQIAWSGDPTDARIGLSANYKTKVPLSGLTSDPQYAGNRVNVDCIIRLNGKLMNPDISFGLDIPNTDEEVKNMVFSLLDTTNSAEMSEQVLYILVMNQFKPTKGNSSTVDVGATSFSLVTNQINSWLSQLSSNVNVGLNYQPGNATTSQEFDVALSTQLFNDRLLIDGTFGMNRNTTTSTAKQANTIVGDINIEYVLTKNRRWRVRAFNRTNTIDLLYNNSLYTQGVGISYQQDFNKWKDLFKRSVKSTGKK